MARLVEQLGFVEGFPAVNLATGVNTGDFVSLKNYGHVAILFASGVGTNGEDPTITIEQAQDVAGTGHKALNFTTIYRKQAATSLAATVQFTKTTQTAANTYTNTDAAEQSCLWVVEFDAEELDLANGFDCVQCSVNDVGNDPQGGYLLYILSEPRFGGVATDMASAIAD